MVRIPKGNVLLDGGKSFSLPEPVRITFAQAVELTPGPDWYYWMALRSWTPEEAALLFLSVDPHTATSVHKEHRAFRQVMDAISKHNYAQDRPPREWAEILLNLPCFQGMQKTTHRHHPFSYLSEYFVDAPTPQERIADLERQLAEARQENEVLTAEVVNLRAEAAEAEGAEADPFNLTPVQIRDLKAFIMKAEGKTTEEIGDELHPDTPGTSLKDVVGRSIRKGKNLIMRSDKPTA